MISDAVRRPNLTTYTNAEIGFLIAAPCIYFIGKHYILTQHNFTSQQHG